MRRALLMILSLATLAAAPCAWSEEAIPTAHDSDTPTDTKTPPSLDQPSPFVGADDIIRIGPCGAVQRQSDAGPIDKRAHGQIEVGVGSGGYRHVGGVICKPIGENASVTVAVDHTEWDRAGRRRLAGAWSPDLEAWEAQTGAEPPYVSMGRVR